ncbi:ATP-grasp domain-containing protein [Streptomyces sp. NPDC046557]|uniref:ATP-grasp domain-containing protein n=1 Tax=Streptomyces sp. NPDC046557 TaxID=3155372 RepID=UPI0033CD4E58
MKPPREKSFPAVVYPDGSRLPAGPDARTPVLLSEVVEFAVEYRLFLLDGEIAAGSRYAVYGRLDCAPLDTDPRPGDVRDRWRGWPVGSCRTYATGRQILSPVRLFRPCEWTAGRGRSSREGTRL